MAEKKVPALRLTLGGASANWYSVVGLPGHYHPDIAVPVGGPGEAPLEAAKAAAKDKGAPVELVQITEQEADQARALVADQGSASLRAVRDAIKDGDQDAPNVESEAAALVGGEES